MLCRFHRCSLSIRYTHNIINSKPDETSSSCNNKNEESKKFLVWRKNYFRSALCESVRRLSLRLSTNFVSFFLFKICRFVSASVCARLWVCVLFEPQLYGWLLNLNNLVGVLIYWLQTAEDYYTFVVCKWIFDLAIQGNKRVYLALDSCLYHLSIPKWASSIKRIIYYNARPRPTVVHCVFPLVCRSSLYFCCFICTVWPFAICAWFRRSTANGTHTCTYIARHRRWTKLRPLSAEKPIHCSLHSIHIF